MTALLARRRIGGVTPISRAELAAIIAAGALPPRDGVGMDTAHALCRPPTSGEVDLLEWWVSGDLASPSAIMALQSRYDFAASRDLLEIVAVDGHRFGVARLFLNARELAHDRGARLGGEIVLQNTDLAAFVETLGMKPTRTRWELEPNG